MSRIIKSHNLKIVGVTGCDQQDAFERNLTQEHVSDLYEEAKVMVEDFIFEAKTKAETIIEIAKSKAEEILQDAEKEKEEIKANAFSEGFQSGHEAGLLELETRKEEANLIITRAHGERKKILGNMEKEIIDFTLMMVEKITRSQIESNPEIIGNIAQDLLTLVQDSNKVNLRLNCSDYEYLESQKDGLQSILSYGILHLEADHTLAKGDCLIVSETGIIEAKIDDQLEKLHNLLREVTNSD